MSKEFYAYQRKCVETGTQQLIENIKILLYQTDPTIFDRIDFDNDLIYKEPLLFAYFNSQEINKTTLSAILYGYTKPNLRPLKIQVISDEFGRIYLPNIGWLKTEKQNQLYDLTANNDNWVLFESGKTADFKFESIELISNTNIEFLKYPVPLLKQFYYDADQNSIDVEITNIADKHKNNLTNAWGLIKEYAPEHFKLIEITTSKCVVFNVDTYLRNSFATLPAQGIGFFNAYQDTYNEVFFVDDIAHQTGHIIFNASIYEVKKFLLVDPATILQTLHLGNNTTETRNILIIFHALYTYYTSFICLDGCLNAGVFKGQKRQEALGRISFYLNKCYNDMILIEEPEDSSMIAEKLFTQEGLILYEGIKSTFKAMAAKWRIAVKDFNMNNQPYNFTYSKFLELNP